jgi:hypothetical protein
MSNRDEERDERDPAASDAEPESPLRPSGYATIRHEDSPTSPAGVKLIHPRRPMPAVPEAPKTPTPEDEK